MLAFAQVVENKRKEDDNDGYGYYEDYPDGTTAFIVGAICLIVGIALLTRVLIGMGVSLFWPSLHCTDGRRRRCLWLPAGLNFDRGSHQARATC